jgi:hypothetical protein
MPKRKCKFKTELKKNILASELGETKMMYCMQKFLVASKQNHLSLGSKYQHYQAQETNLGVS